MCPSDGLSYFLTNSQCSIHETTNLAHCVMHAMCFGDVIFPMLNCFLFLFCFLLFCFLLFCFLLFFFIVPVLKVLDVFMRFYIGFCDGKLTKIPKWDFIFARVKTGQVGTWSPTEISPVQSSFLRQIRTGILREGIIYWARLATAGKGVQNFTLSHTHQATKLLSLR